MSITLIESGAYPRITYLEGAMYIFCYFIHLFINLIWSFFYFVYLFSCNGDGRDSYIYDGP